MSQYETEPRRSVGLENESRQDSQETKLREGAAVGDVKWKDKDGVIRLAFQNIQGLGFDRRQRKYRLIYNFIKNYSVDMFGMAEINTYWPKTKVKDSMFEKNKGMV